MSSSENLTASQSEYDTEYEPSSVEEQEQSSGNESSQGRRAQVPEEERRRVPQREEGKPFIDNYRLIPLVQERVALWDTRDRRHSDSRLIRRLWDEVARLLLADWDRATSQDRKDFLKRVKVRWCSLKDRFNKDRREEIRVRSGAAPKVMKSKYYRMLSFLNPAVAQRTTWSSTTEPGSSSVGAAPHRPAIEQSQSSTSDGATNQASPSAFPLSQPSATGFVGSSHQRRRAWERSVMPEFIHIGSVFQDGMRAVVERLDSEFTQMSTRFQEVHRHIDRLEAELPRPSQPFIQPLLFGRNRARHVGEPAS